MSREAWRLVLLAAARGLDEWQAELDDLREAGEGDGEAGDVARWEAYPLAVELRQARAAFSLLWERHCS